MIDFGITSENEYRRQSARQDAQARRLVKEARAGQHRARHGGRAIGIGYVVQMVVVMLGR
jgi:hypothetical protein